MQNTKNKLDFRAVVVSDDATALRLLDQRALPAEEIWLELHDTEEVARAIEDLAVRGAPAIGCAAACGLAVASLGFPTEPKEFRAAVVEASARLARTRPTAVNLFVALQAIRVAMDSADESADADALRGLLFETARRFVDDDYASCLAIGEHGKGLMPKSGGVLTHCNTGALATAGWGTALGVIRSAHEAGHEMMVYADETRPVLQGGRLTAWELDRAGIPVKVIADNMAGALMAQGKIDVAIVGADRITANGDVANKIGTYSVAVLCKHHGIPFYVAAPWTTIDLSLSAGSEIPIEQRDPDEVRKHGGTLMTPANIAVENPAFDVTPAELITGIITERGVHEPTELSLARRGNPLLQ